MSELDRLVVEIDLDKQGSISEPSNAPASESWVLNWHITCILGSSASLYFTYNIAST